MKKRTGMILVAALLCVGMSACSYREAEDSLREDIADAVSNTKSDDDGAEAEGQTEKALNNKSVLWKDVYGQEVQYEVQSVQTAATLEELNIAPEECSFVGSVTVDEAGTLLNEKGEVLTLISADIIISNVSFESAAKGADAYVYSVDSRIAGEDAIDSADGLGRIGAIYFSGHSAEEKDYFKFYLGAGSSSQVKLVWAVPQDVSEKSLYYVVGEGMGQDAEQYLRLTDTED